MKPEAAAIRVLSTTRAKAKMFEFRVPLEDHIELPRNPNILFSLAVGILGDAAAAIADGFLGAASKPSGGQGAKMTGESWDPGDSTLRDSSQGSMTFAATYFDAFLGSHLDETLTGEFSLLCASSYYLAGSPGSSRVIIRNTEAPSSTNEGGLPALAYAILADDFAAVDGPYEYADFGEPLRAALRGFFATENDGTALVAACRSLREKAYALGTARQLLYADVSVALCHNKLANASRSLLPLASGLTLDAWRSPLVKPHFPRELWPAQMKICDAGLLKGRSAIIQMPTSAGKTRATELIIRSAFLSERTSLTVIVAPFRSLCHDIRADLAVAFAGENVALNEATDSYQLDLSLDEMLARKTILIVTPEKLLYMLRRVPELSEGIGLVIYDEGHQFEGMARGPTYELLLTSLKVTLLAGTQVVLISAVIGNARDVAAWLIGDPDSVVHGEGLLPTTKSIAFASWGTARGRLEYVSPHDPDEREFFVPRVIEAASLDRRPRELKDRVFPEHKGTDVGLYLGLQLVLNGSVAVFCGRKDSAALLCDRAIEIFSRNAPFTMPVKVSDEAEVSKIAFLFGRHLGPESSSARAATLGIFPHHANVPQGLRLAIEHAMKEGLAKFVICTSTLAQGVNFPLKYLIVTTTQQGQERIMVRDFHNLIGRAGRAGMHTEGSIIFASPEVYDEKASSSRGRWRWQATKNLLNPNNAEPVSSSILSVFDPYEQSHPPINLEITTGQLQSLAFADAAAVEAVVMQGLRRNPLVSVREFRAFLNGRARAVQSIATFLLSHVTFEDDTAADRVTELATNTLAYHLAAPNARSELVDLVQGIAAMIVNNADADLRPFIRKSPLSPAATTELRRWIEENLESLRTVSHEGLLQAIYEQLSIYITSPSVKTFSDQNIIRPALQAWIGGESFREIHAVIAAADARIGNRRAKIEDTVALCESGFGYDAAMIVASLADFAETLDSDLRNSLALLQQRVKYGLSTASAIGFFECGFADRVVAIELAQVFPNVQDRSQASTAVRRNAKMIRTVLAEFPNYFTSVLDEIAGV
ncbi:MAG TPA: DEAD/DEAH box helicase [Stellaceae bacterium]|nr:DEAD/DEAH box helicase [Stellaceae bacterium]